MIEIATEKTRIFFLIYLSLCVYSRKLRWLMWLCDPSWSLLVMVVSVHFKMSLHKMDQISCVTNWANYGVTTLLLPPSDSSYFSKSYSLRIVQSSRLHGEQRLLHLIRCNTKGLSDTISKMQQQSFFKFQKRGSQD